MLFYFFAHHGAWSFLVLIFVGIVLSIWQKTITYVILVFVLAIFNVFTGQFVNAIFLNQFGIRGSAIITLSKETSSTLNDQYIWDYDVVMKTADGKDVVTKFSTTTASLYPVRNSILIPPDGERFVVKYIPGFEKNIVIMTDESSYGKKRITHENLEPVQKARNQFESSPSNESFRKAYADEIRTFLENPENATDTINLIQLKTILSQLQNK
ncbi:hypothetical protein DBR11_03945 [Pedobacter sp. HMWF019]|nr:hypothetical protein DBR11_03945 [Pedobacter sp. HMWF019]